MRWTAIAVLLGIFWIGPDVQASNELTEWVPYYDWCNTVRLDPSRNYINCFCPARLKDLNYYFSTLKSSYNPTEIPKRWICDGASDCPDNSDEKDCLCSPQEYQCGCPLRTQHCYHGQGCYSESDICNGRMDCMDGTDELNCTCPSGTFRCACQDNNTCAYPEVCILEHQTCDGKSDCSDGSDEADCQCAGEFSCGCRYVNGKCQEPTKCIPLLLKCDSHDDCANSSDELDCQFAQRQFYCACARNSSCVSPNPSYIPLEYVCDLNNNCGDWSDEINCPCDKGDHICKCNVLGCNTSSGCVNLRKYGCDGIDNCGDWSDEINCTFDYKRFNCECFTNNQTCSGNVASVTLDKVCDGTYQCSDHSDERSCQCHAPKFQCKCADAASDACTGNDWCISSHKVCDGYTDCLDGSDELNCTYPSDFFNCTCASDDSCTGRYLAVGYRLECNGKNECGDWSDEDTCSCGAGKFMCDCYKTSPITCNVNDGCLKQKKVCDHINDCGDWSDERDCNFFQCACSSSNVSALCYAESISGGRRCDLVNDCGDWSDENNCTCPPNSFECPCNYPGCEAGPGCVSTKRVCDGINDCGDWSDEANCSCPAVKTPCACYARKNKTCHFKNGCLRPSQVCDGVNDCGDWSGELGCNCTSGQVRCGCLFNNSSCVSNKGCIDRSSVNNGKVNCFGGEDEPCVTNYNYCDNNCQTKAMYCPDAQAKAKMLHYENASLTHCFPVLSKTFTNNTIGEQKPDWACISTTCGAGHPGCKVPFVCDNKQVIIANRFCDGSNECSDKSDESYDHPGFKCATGYSAFTCVLPQINLYDDIPQCSDGSDLCFANGTMHCFQCFDKRLIISPKQVCDGVVDCYDLSDECFCANQTACNDVLGVSKTSCPPGKLYCNETVGCLAETAVLCKWDYKCTNSTNTVACINAERQKTISCFAASGPVEAVICDGRPQCDDLSDECGNCPNKPWFCDDPCRLYYPIGDRYCDGQIDAVSSYIDEPFCPNGFDERNCSKRFYCANGISVSIDVNQVCDGIINCENGEDETKARCADKRFYCLDKKPMSVAKNQVEDGKWDCADGSDECPPQTDKVTVFSSQYELIGNKIILAVFWIMALLSIAGNAVVFATTAKSVLVTDKMSKVMQYNSLFVLNLSVSDFLMGVYLLIICIKTAQFSGSYCFHDKPWRTSWSCSFLGVLVVLSTETSVFIMTFMTTFRLVTIFRPFITSTLKIIWGKLAVATSWILATLIATFPLMFPTSGYFVSGVWFPNYFYKSDQVAKADVNTLAFRMGQTNISSWSKTKKFIQAKLPYLPIKGDIGYYGETSVCMPRLFVNVGDDGWGFSTFLILLNFLLFLYMVVSYVVIYRLSTRRAGKFSTKRSRKMQRRITRLILTDFACWVPLCTLAFIQLSGVPLPLVVYAISAGILLPTNSAINPLLYSDTISGVVCSLFSCGKRRPSQSDASVSSKAVTMQTTHSKSLASTRM